MKSKLPTRIKVLFLILSMLCGFVFSLIASFTIFIIFSNQLLPEEYLEDPTRNMDSNTILFYKINDADEDGMFTLKGVNKSWSDLTFDVTYEKYVKGEYELVTEQMEPITLSENLEDGEFSFELQIPKEVRNAIYVLDDGSKPGEEKYDSRKEISISNENLFESSGYLAKLDAAVAKHEEEQQAIAEANAKREAEKQQQIEDNRIKELSSSSYKTTYAIYVEPYRFVRIQGELGSDGIATFNLIDKYEGTFLDTDIIQNSGEFDIFLSAGPVDGERILEINYTTNIEWKVSVTD